MREMVTESGACLWVRSPELPDDWVVNEVYLHDMYRLNARRLDGMTVLDCGAHIGAFTTRCLQHGAAKVFAIEPEPGNLEMLRRNVKGLPVEVIPKALGAQATMVSVVGNCAVGHTVPGGDIEQTTLAAILDDYGLAHVDIVKMDMEGAEAPTLLGCDHDHLRRIDRIMCETHGPPTCPWLEPTVDQIVAHLSVTHRVEAIPQPYAGMGMLFAEIGPS